MLLNQFLSGSVVDICRTLSRLVPKSTLPIITFDFFQPVIAIPTPLLVNLENLTSVLIESVQNSVQKYRSSLQMYKEKWKKVNSICISVFVSSVYFKNLRFLFSIPSIFHPPTVPTSYLLVFLKIFITTNLIIWYNMNIIMHCCILLGINWIDLIKFLL